MEECSVLIETTKSAEDNTSRWFDLPIDYELFRDLLGVEAVSYTHLDVYKRQIEGVKIGAGTHKRLAGVPFRITSKTTGESHIVVTDKNGQFSTASSWASHKVNTNAGKSSEDGVWFGTSEPDDSKGALLYDTYVIEELKCDSNAGFKLIPAFEVVVSRNKVTVDLGTLTEDVYKRQVPDLDIFRYSHALPPPSPVPVSYTHLFTGTVPLLSLE